MTQAQIKPGLDFYEQMVMIRLFEEKAVELFAAGHISGSTHPCIGQEAIPVGICSALRPDDFVLATYRGHGAVLAKGSDPGRVMAEVLTRRDGYCKGRGGSMHICDVQNGVLGTNAIVAGHIPISGGVALSCKLRRTQQVTACFFGDGAGCEGEFFETLNMAALWRIPLLLVCENNGYAISVPVAQSQATPDLADRARGVGIEPSIVDGNDVIAVSNAAQSAVTALREGRGPAFIECKTVRWERHSAFSSGKYANPEEAQKWRRVDPIPIFAGQLIAAGASDAQLVPLREKAERVVNRAVEFALNSPPPALESVWEGIYAEAQRSEKTTR
jgi:TPP-dependent pyruvate/acetoin dehydrogenase alpha subunit